MAMVLSYVGVKAIIVQDDKVLLLKGEANAVGDVWDFPGGRIDDEEDLHDALRRELDEELPGIKDVEIGRLVDAYRVPGFRWPGKALTLIFYEVKADVSQVVAVSHEHESLEWVGLDRATTELNSWVANQLKAYRAL